MARLSSAARAARQDDEIDVDYSERAGFLTGKAAAIADWAHRRESKEYAKLFERLYKRNRRRLELVAQGVPFVESDGVPTRVFHIVCEVCRAPVVKLQPNARWCSKKCANRWHGIPRSRARNRGIRNTTLSPTVLTILDLEPWLTLPEILERAAGAKYGSTATLLCAWVKAGVLQHRRGANAFPRRGTRYALATLWRLKKDGDGACCECRAPAVAGQKRCQKHREIHNRKERDVRP